MIQFLAIYAACLAVVAPFIIGACCVASEADRISEECARQIAEAREQRVLCSWGGRRYRFRLARHRQHPGECVDGILDSNGR